MTVTTTEKARFAIRFSPYWTWLLALVGITRGRSFVSVSDSQVEVRFGWFRLVFPRVAIASVRETRGQWYWGIGIHTNGVRLVVNGALSGLVELQLSPPQRAWLLFPIRCKRLIVSLEQPAAFIQALSVPAAPSGA